MPENITNLIGPAIERQGTGQKSPPGGQIGNAWGLAGEIRKFRSEALSNTERARFLEEPNSMRQSIALLSAGKKKGWAEEGICPARERRRRGPKIANVAKKLLAALQALLPGKRNDTCDALGQLRK